VAIQRSAADGRIVRNPRVLGGEPIVRGTRISVRSIVLASREFGGPDGVRAAYPQLTADDVSYALAFYEAHTEEVESHIQANLAEA
jgi:uncharacterized protein (DUF433 family)